MTLKGLKIYYRTEIHQKPADEWMLVTVTFQICPQFIQLYFKKQTDESFLNYYPIVRLDANLRRYQKHRNRSFLIIICDWQLHPDWIEQNSTVCVLKQQHWHIRVSAASGRDFFKHVTVTLLKCHFFLFFLSFFFAFYDFPRLWNSHWFTVNLKWFLFLSPGCCSFLTLTFKDGGHGNTFSSSMCPFMVARQIR